MSCLITLTSVYYVEVLMHSGNLHPSIKAVANQTTVLSFKQSFVRPVESELSEELCKTLKIQPDVITGAASLDVVLQQFDQYLRQELNANEDASFCICTDGQLHIRQCLHPQATSKGVELPDYFYQFFDIRKEFRRKYPEAPIIIDVKDMAQFLNIDVGSYDFTETGVDESRTMASIVQKLLSDGHRFMEPDRIRGKYEPGTFEKTDSVSDDTVVKARGLPWQASDRDVFRFFKGLNIAKGGVALCLNSSGRRNGEVMVHFENSENRDMALQRHKHNLGKRYVEVFKATGEEFIKVAAGTSRDAALFLSRDDGHIIVRMRGLPFTATAQNVIEFFGPECPVAGGEHGILFVKHRNGKMTGDAFVMFASEESAGKAVEKHKQYLGSRYIEIFRSTTAEVQQVLSRLHSEPLIPDGPPQTMPQAIPTIPVPPALLTQQFITSGAAKDCIRLRGLPFTAAIEDIMRFLGEHAHFIRPQGIHMVYNLQGKPNGEAFIQMTAQEHAYMAAQSCHMKYMGERYVEVFQCSGDEMSMVLMGGPRQMPKMSMSMPVPGAIAPTTPLAYPNMPMSSPHPGATVIPTLPVPARHPGATTFLPQHHPVYYFPTPPVSPTAPLIYPGSNSAFIRLRGLHAGTAPQEVAQFFQGYGVPTESVHLQPNGDAVVSFYTQEIAIKALQDKQRMFGGKMELFVA
ncbi:putative epithelial splicing regulatory protein 2 [Apostichopus japonicus]|uniref:Putative epithelial splicing regulatory protein 2 n=1 Tax=Stichopus japonicus TaxID=307972 RepID=A0A2G8LCR3_STIJA|nr:putative epithelial splicing regulatory protein 2 [Apostichopus japonicus]